MIKFHLKPSLFHDGLTIEDGQVIIHQRTLGQGDIIIPLRDVTEVRGTQGIGGPLVIQGSLHLRVGSKKYALRHLPKKQRDAALRALQEAIAAP